MIRARRDTEYCDVTIHWKGGYTSQHEVTRPVHRQGQQRDADRLRERVTELSRQGETAAVIAERLNAEGFVPPRQRGPYNNQHVWQLLRKYGLTIKRGEEELAKDEWRLPELAGRLKVSCNKLREWVLRKWCHARQTTARKLWVIWADREERDRLRRLKTHSKLGKVSYPPELTTPKQRQK